MSVATAAPKSLYSVNGHDMRLHLHPGQWRAWASQRRFIFMLAGTQGGKTSFGPHWLRREIEWRGPGDYLAVTSTFPLLKLKMLPEFLSIFQHILGLGTWNGSDRVFQFSDSGSRRTFGKDWNGEPTRVIFGSATNPESLESATAKAAWLDEVGQDDFRLESWEAIMRRLSLHEGRVLGGTTIYNLGWLKHVIYDRWQRGDDEIDVIQFASNVNPAFPESEFLKAGERLPEWKYLMFYKGLFSKPAGMIYSDFVDDYRERGGHKVHPFAIPPEWPRYGGLDFGAVNTARLMAAHDPEANVYYLYSESLDGGKTTNEHAADALEAVASVNMATWHGGSKSESQQRMDWQAAGVYVHEPIVTDVESGIDRVIALFKTRRLYLVDTCVGTLSELGMYSRVVDDLGDPTEKIKDKDTFHRLDALRYLAQGLDVPEAAGVNTPDVSILQAYGADKRAMLRRSIR